MALPAAVVGIVVMMVIPLPTALLDLLLSLNIAAAVLRSAGFEALPAGFADPLEIEPADIIFLEGKKMGKTKLFFFINTPIINL